MKKRVARTSQPVDFEIPSDKAIDNYVDKSLAIARYISSFMKSHAFRQKDVADSIGKTEAEISKWMSGFHNMTLKSILKLEAACPINILNPAIWRNSDYNSVSKAHVSYASFYDIHGVRLYDDGSAYLRKIGIVPKSLTGNVRWESSIDKHSYRNYNLADKKIEAFPTLLQA